MYKFIILAFAGLLSLSHAYLGPCGATNRALCQCHKNNPELAGGDCPAEAHVMNEEAMLAKFKEIFAQDKDLTQTNSGFLENENVVRFSNDEHIAELSSKIDKGSLK